MRKDVQNVAKYFSRQDAKAGRDIDLLRWPNAPDMALRYATLLSAIDFTQWSAERPLKLLDFGCGLGLLIEYLSANSLLDRVDYTGVDLLEPMLEEARRRWPGHRFDRRDVRDEPYGAEQFDFCIVCGVFTAKYSDDHGETLELAQDTLKALWPSVKLGLAFNSMSKHVDWERDDLFHWPLDDIMAFCKRDLSRHVAFNLDYGLWEVSTLVRKAPLRRPAVVPAHW